MNNQDHQPDFILASGSPRRRDLLAQLGFSFAVQAADIDESVHPDEAPDDYVIRMAYEKAAAGFQAADTSLCVLGADTAVVLGKQILGKPTDREDALRMLAMLADREHQVLSGVAVTDGERIGSVMSSTTVTFGAMSAADMQAYWNTGEPADKAGAYGIQGLGAAFVRHIAGSYSGVVGLPIFETLEILGEFGIRPAFLNGSQT